MKKKRFDRSGFPSSKQIAEELEREKYKERYIRTFRSTVFILVTVAAIATLIATLLLPVLRIYGTSMTPLLRQGDVVVSTKTSGFKRGDVISFYYNNKILVKRVVAFAGETVDIDDSGNVFVDGKMLDEPYLQAGAKSYGETNIKLPYQVPEDRLFVLGDHRETSIDSRNTAIGAVAEEQVVGKIIFRIWPLGKVGLPK